MTNHWRAIVYKQNQQIYDNATPKINGSEGQLLIIDKSETLKLKRFLIIIWFQNRPKEINRTPSSISSLRLANVFAPFHTTRGVHIHLWFSQLCSLECRLSSTHL